MRDLQDDGLRPALSAPEGESHSTSPDPETTDGSATTSVPPRPARWGLLGAAASLVLVVDQLTKWWAESTLADRSIDVVGSLRFHLIYNTGASFSIGAGKGGLIALGALVAIVGMLLYGRSATNPVQAVALGAVMGGAVGNLIDRALREGTGGFLGGGVVDFIDLQWWPVFNVADIGVSCGAVALVVTSLVEERRAGRAERAAAEAASKEQDRG